MANPEHIQWLLEGVDAWNARRRADPFFEPNLSGENLHQHFRDSGKLLPNGRIPLSSYNLNWSDFQKSRIVAADLDNADLVAANLNDTVLHDSNLAGARLDGADLTFANLDRANLAGARLPNVDLTRANLVRADLRDANLTKAVLFETELRRADLTGANLSLAKPWEAVLYPVASHYPEMGLPSKLVESIDALLSIVRDLKKEYQRLWLDVRFYFRGEPCTKWELRPSVMRVQSDALREYEGNMLVEMARRRPEEFNAMPSALAQWVMARHHLLMTRFLDITQNPLVALFNACWDDHSGKDANEDQTPGRLYVFAVPTTLVKSFNSDTISVIANFAKLTLDDQNLILGDDDLSNPEIIEHQPSQYQEAMNRLYHLIRAEKPHFAEKIDIRDLYKVFVVEPQHSLERIRAQSGAFLVSAFHERLESAEVWRKVKGIPVHHNYALEVPVDCKAGLMEDLALLNITQETLFPGLDSSAAAITRHYSGGG